MSKVRVNIRTAVNSAAIRREQRNGRDVIIVPSATLPDNVVMNGIRYPGDEIEKGYKTLERTPAPLGHPNINGKFVSASDPEGLVQGWIGAWNENVRRENGRVLLDKVIDVEFANQSEKGKAVLAAIDAGDPIHTSTGLYGMTVPTVNDKEAKLSMTNMMFDHDAILLDEEGAATPDQGVGMLVNAKDEKGNEVEVVNSELDWASDDLDWAGMRLLEAAERVERIGRWEAVKGSVLAIFKGAASPATNSNDGDEATMDKAQHDAITGKLDQLATSMAGLPEQISTAIANALKPVADGLEAQTNAAKAKEAAEKAVLVNKVVAGGLLTEAVANSLDLAVLTELSAKAKPTRSAAPITANTNLDTDGEPVGFKVPKAGAN